MLKMQLEITNPTGLHARPAASFVQKVASFKSKVRIAGNNKEADAKSIIGVMSLGLNKGVKVTITADGPDEVECLASLKTLIESNFGEK